MDLSACKGCVYCGSVGRLVGDACAPGRGCGRNVEPEPEGLLPTLFEAVPGVENPPHRRTVRNVTRSNRL